jgi:nickel superoxide dismutase
LYKEVALFDRILDQLEHLSPAAEASAHCDAPCGVYDPASARIAAEAVLSLTKKILALAAPAPGDQAAGIAFLNTLTRYVAIKEQQAEQAKHDLLVLWTDYFKPEHLKDAPNLHEMFWNAAKLCSQCKQTVNEQKASDLLKAVQEIHDVFWKSKKREVPWYTAA